MAGVTPPLRTSVVFDQNRIIKTEAMIETAAQRVFQPRANQGSFCAYRKCGAVCATVRSVARFGLQCPTCGPKFSATRSAPNRAMAGPVMVMTSVPAAGFHRPPHARPVAGVHRRAKAAAAHTRQHAFFRARMMPRAFAPSSTTSGDIAQTPQSLKDRADRFAYHVEGAGVVNQA